MNRSRGLTVVETLIASTIFLIAVVALIGIYPSSARASHQAASRLMATFLAEREMELSLAQDFSALEDRTQSYNLELERNNRSETIRFETKVEIVETRPGLRRVVVRVSWLGPKQSPKKVELESYVAKRTP